MERQRIGFVSWIVRMILFLAVVMGASMLYWYVSLDHTPVYVGRVMVTPRAQAGIPASLTNTITDTVGVIVTSEATLQAAARDLSHHYMISEPGELLRTVKVVPVPNSVVAKIEVTSTNAEEAKAGASVLAEQAQRIYSRTVNDPEALQSDANTWSLKIVEKARVFPAKSNGIIKTARFTAGFTAVLLLFLFGIAVGRGKRESRSLRWPIIAVISPAVVFLLCAGVVAYTRSQPRLYIGRALLFQRLSEKDLRRPYRAERLDEWAASALKSRAAKKASRMLRLLDVSVSPDMILRSTKIEWFRDTEILKIEYASADAERAEAVTGVIASELQKDYSKAGKPSLYLLEDARVHPVAKWPDITLFAYIAVVTMALLYGAGIGLLLRLRKRSQTLPETGRE